jgi:two-component system nitrogen regulation response regulator GlnG
MQEVFKSIGAASLTDAPLLLVGENGTGKEMTARAIHYSSSRAEGPFETVNCGAVPEGRILRELFAADGTGRLSRADGGTLFVDEAHSLAPAAQAELARFLADGEYSPTGESGKRSANARVIGAMDRSPESEVEEGRLREDLYYRLGVVTIRLPPLRERAADIPLLVGRFLEDRKGGALTREALRAILVYSWPGNVTELKNAVEHAAVMSRGDAILPEHLPDHVHRGAESETAPDEALIRETVERALENAGEEDGVYQPVMDRFEAPLIAAVLEKTGGNQVQAAKLLGIHRTTLRTKIRKHGL